jgi:rare lipoprotein A
MSRILRLCLALAAIGGVARAQTQAPVTVPFDPQDPRVQAQARPLAALPPVRPPPGRHAKLDPSGRKQVGEASVFSGRLSGRHMADGKRFHPTGIAAASRTLPIGTVAKVTNTQTGKTALVRVEDRGPFVDGRTMDLSRATANQIGITKHEGVVPVQVAPVAVPQKDGTVKVGAGAVPGPVQ